MIALDQGIEETMQRRWLVGAAGATAAFAGFGIRAETGADEPRPLVVVVPGAAGSGTDASARVLARAMAAALGTPTVVLDRPGDGGKEGLAAIAAAPPDGLTLGVLTTRLALLRRLGQGATDAAALTPIGLYNEDPAAVHVRADSPYHGLADLLDALAAGTMATASGGPVAGVWHLALAGLLRAAGQAADAARWQPSRSSAGAIAALLEGRIDLVVCSLADAQAAGDRTALRALAVASAERLTAFPTVATVAEASGIDWAVAGWRGLVGPAGLAAKAVAPLVMALKAAHASPEFQTAMAARGYRPVFAGPEAFAALIEASNAHLGPVAAGLADAG